MTEAERNAIIEQCARTIDPYGPRPCACDECDCSNSDDLAAVVGWDTSKAGAAAIRALASDSVKADLTHNERQAAMSVMASLAATISLLERTPSAKKAAPSDKMFHMMLADYKRALETARTTLASDPVKTADAWLDEMVQPGSTGAKAKFERQIFGAAVAQINETDYEVVEVQARNDGKFLLTIHNRRGDTNLWDDMSATLEPKHFEMLGSIASQQPLTENRSTISDTFGPNVGPPTEKPIKGIDFD